MAGADITVVVLIVIGFGLVARRLDRWNVSAPMLFLAAGALVFGLGAGLPVAAPEVHLLAEITLVLVLFHDASTVRLRALRSDAALPIRLLLIGFPLAVAMTFAVTTTMFPALGVAGAVLIAAAITPTDAGLGAPTVLNPEVPIRIRRVLNVESGLNDGLATPIVLFALSALAVAEERAENPLLEMALYPVLVGLTLGVVVALVCAAGLDWSHRKGASSARSRTVVMLAVPLLAFGLAEMLEANVFIAAFVAGLVFGAACRTQRSEPAVAELLETTTDLMGYLVWFLAGGLLVSVLTAGFQWQWLVLAVLALTVLRMVPVALVLIGSGLDWRSVAFIGWFGPRGLATVIFSLLAVETLGTDNPVIATTAGVLSMVVLLSVFGHGVSAGRWARRYGAWVSRHPDLPEAAVSAHPAVRGGIGRGTDAEPIENGKRP